MWKQNFSETTLTVVHYNFLKLYLIRKKIAVSYTNQISQHISRLRPEVWKAGKGLGLPDLYL
jgi:hypothetical protein